MKEELQKIQEKAIAALNQVKQTKDLDDIKVKFLGKKGELTAILKGMKDLTNEQRPIIGQLANEVRTEGEGYKEKLVAEIIFNHCSSPFFSVVFSCLTVRP